MDVVYFGFLEVAFFPATYCEDAAIEEDTAKEHARLNHGGALDEVHSHVVIHEGLPIVDALIFTPDEEHLLTGG